MKGFTGSSEIQNRQDWKTMKEGKGLCKKEYLQLLDTVMNLFQFELNRESNRSKLLHQLHDQVLFRHF